MVFAGYITLMIVFLITSCIIHVRYALPSSYELKCVNEFIFTWKLLVLSLNTLTWSKCFSSISLFVSIIYSCWDACALLAHNHGCMSNLLPLCPTIRGFSNFPYWCMCYGLQHIYDPLNSMKYMNVEERRDNASNSFTRNILNGK